MTKSDRDNIKFLLITGGAVFIAYKAFGAFKGIFERGGKRKTRKPRKPRKTRKTRKPKTKSKKNRYY